MNWWRAIIPGLLILPIIVVLALAFGTDPRAIPFALRDRPAPAFNLQSLDGRTFNSTELAGKPVVLNFWSTWCGPCKYEHEYLQRGAQQYAGRVVFLGVIYEDDPDKARSYLASRSNVFPQLIDQDSKLAIEYGVSGVPETYIIDPSGIVRHKEAGPITDAAYLAQLIHQATQGAPQ